VYARPFSGLSVAEFLASFSIAFTLTATLDFHSAQIEVDAASSARADEVKIDASKTHEIEADINRCIFNS
jgi:hypothetical protein